jgi:hypothetical protein
MTHNCEISQNVPTYVHAFTSILNIFIQKYDDDPRGPEHAAYL